MTGWKPLLLSTQILNQVLYLLILYAYVTKILLQWSWPNGWVAMPIFALGVISLLTYVLSLPLSKTENWARLYHRWLFRLLLPITSGRSHWKRSWPTSANSRRARASTPDAATT